MFTDDPLSEARFRCLADILYLAMAKGHSEGRMQWSVELQRLWYGNCPYLVSKWSFAMACSREPDSLILPGLLLLLYRVHLACSDSNASIASGPTVDPET